MQRFLCWDEKNIEKKSGIRVNQHSPQKKNIALKCSDKWEGVHNGYGGIMKVDGKYRMYYRACGHGCGFIEKNPCVDSASAVCVAESDDGITFTKPMVGRYEFGGDKNNNIVFMHSGVIDSFSVFYDTNPTCPESEKFKAVCLDIGADHANFYASTDGYDFRYVERINLDGTFDTYNVAFWDEDTEEYRMYFRGFHRADGENVCLWDIDYINDIRDVRLATSRDFRNWDYKGIIRFDEGQTDIPLYTNQIIRYYREPSTMIGFPVRYIDRDAEKKNYRFMPLADIRNNVIERENRTGTAITDCAIMTSSDGFTFNRREKAFMSPGIESENNWWYGDCYMVYGLVETENEEGSAKELSFYMGENYRIRDVDFRRYTLRLDGFFSWTDDGNGGELITKPFVLQNKNMYINFETSALGSAAVIVLDKDGNELEGYRSYTAFGNSTNRRIEFEKPLDELINSEIKLKIELKDCNIYSYTFEN